MTETIYYVVYPNSLITDNGPGKMELKLYLIDHGG